MPLVIERNFKSLLEIQNIFCVGNLRLTNSGSHRCRREDVGSRFSNQVSQSALRSRQLIKRINACFAIKPEQATKPHSLAFPFEIRNDQSTVTLEFASGSRSRHRFHHHINQARSLSVLQHARLRKSLRARQHRCKTTPMQDNTDATQHRCNTTPTQHNTDATHQQCSSLDGFREESVHTARAC